MVFELAMTIGVATKLLGIGYSALAIFTKSKLVAILAVVLDFAAFMLM